MKNIKLKISSSQTANYLTLNSSNDFDSRTIVADQEILSDTKMDQPSVDSHVESARLASYIPRGVFGFLVMK